jgi:hypothetical protein
LDMHLPYSSTPVALYLQITIIGKIGKYHQIMG